MRFLVVGAGSWGTAFTRVLLDRGHDVVARAATRRAGATRSRETAATRATCRASTCAASTAVPLDDAPADVDLIVVAVPSAGVRRGRRGAARAGARAQADEGSRPRDRRAALDARPGPPGRRALRPEHGGGDRRRPADRGGDRERGRLPRRPAAARDQLVRLPRLRQPGRRRRRALRRREERDRARRGRRRRPRPRRQREGGAGHARPRRRWRGSARRAARAPRRSPASPAWAT